MEKLRKLRVQSAVLTVDAETNQAEVTGNKKQAQNTLANLDKLIDRVGGTQAELNKCKIQLQEMIKKLEKQTEDFCISEETIRQLYQGSTSSTGQMDTKYEKSKESEKTNFRLWKDVKEQMRKANKGRCTQANKRRKRNEQYQKELKKAADEKAATSEHHNLSQPMLGRFRPYLGSTYSSENEWPPTTN